MVWYLRLVKFVATLSFDLLLIMFLIIASFLTLIFQFSQGSVVTFVRHGRIFNDDLITNLLTSLQ